MINEPIVFQFKNPEAPNTLYLDRDGVLNEVVIRSGEVSSPRTIHELNLSSDIEVLSDPKIVDTWNLVVITNQPDLSRKLIDINFLEKINSKILEKIPVNIFYVCPHQSIDNCICRKPKIGMIENYRREYPSYIKNEVMIGDTNKDLKCAEKANINFILKIQSYNLDLKNSAPYNISSFFELSIISEYS